MAEGRAGPPPERWRLRAGDVTGASLAERLGHGLHRLAWRTPLHQLRLRGRYPLRLVAVPIDPVPGRAKAGRALLAGAMLVGDEQVALNALARGGFSPAFAEHLHAFHWLRDLAAAATPDEAAPLAASIADGWLSRHAAQVADPAWRPDLLGRRILMWSAYAPLLLGEDARRRALLNLLARGARHLDRAADAGRPGVPRVAAWSGVVAAGLLIPGGELRVAHGEQGLARALAQALHPDGGVAERGPSAQLDLVELLGQLGAVYRSRERQLPAAAARQLGDARAMLAAVTLGDGQLSSWQGGGPASRARTTAALAGALPSMERSRSWGYQPLAAGETRLVMDAAPPPPAALVRGACASTLAFELADGAQRLVVNCGGGPGIPAELAVSLRTTAAHSTLVLAETNSTALNADGTLGRGVREVDVERGPGMLTAAHDGYVARLGFRHERRLMLAGDGRLVEGEDRLVPAGRRRAPAATPCALHFHLAPGLDPVLTADGQGALVGTRDGIAWQFRTKAGSLALEPSLWIDALGRPRATQALLVSAETPPDGVMVAWSWRKLR